MTPVSGNKKDLLMCSNIKREGKQQTFCEEKFLETSEKKVVGCFTNFCETCCEDDKECVKNCNFSHSDSSAQDPEEVFINICKNENMIGKILGYCNKFYENIFQLKLCQRGFCTDCCQNELKIQSKVRSTFNFQVPLILRCKNVLVSVCYRLRRLAWS